jgi:hypothetical protein
MMRIRITQMVVACTTVIVSFIAAGCGDDNNPTGNKVNPASPALAAISPVDGASNVSRTTTISIRFTTPMDTSSVMGAFHLSGGSDMALWMDSIGHHQGMGGMGMMNMDHMLQWMDSIEYSGQWHWNATRDSCWFVADSMLMADADHMVYLYGTMRSHEDALMNTGTMPYGAPMYHFSTEP